MDATTPDNETISWILYVMEKEYTEAAWRLPGSWWSWEAFVEAVRHLEMTSSPGIPYMKEAPTIGDWLRWDGVQCDDFQLRRLWHEVQQVFDEDFRLKLRVFIKQEPHKKSKAEDGRWRLILASPLNVQVAWHMLFSYMNDIEIDKAYYLPSQQGLNLSGGMWKLYLNQWKTSRQTCGMDKTAWDWTAPWWVFLVDLEFRRRMCRRGDVGSWLRKAKVLYHQMFEQPILVLSDGSEFEQLYPGIMKSGCVNTISTNSHAQCFVHLAVCRKNNLPYYPLPKCVGDDTLSTEEQIPANIMDLYAEFGVRIKSVTDTLEFVGREFRDCGPIPMYVGKHVAKAHYVSEENLVSYLDSMAREYCHSESYYRVWEALAERLGIDLPLSRESYLYWYDYQGW
ncbi:hypothetical protein 2 [Wuhan insect virus 34]|uniref:hypothetical protein 2 n=1 Tax=Wuhan insect virus 34 TaxID=1923737 RepID=UPI00090AF706|nr:hypothetical protein 2 [Wuhan insect virus 34]APG75724.1 hypothetical protein 2 [Wuhan insect virus 34]